MPAKRGARIRLNGAEGVIVAAAGSYLRVRFSGKIKTIHPTWQVEYLPAPETLNQGRTGDSK